MGAEIGKATGWARLVLIQPDGTREPEGTVYVQGYHAAGDPQGNPEVPTVRYWAHEAGRPVERRAGVGELQMGLRREVESVKGGAA